LVWAGVLLKKLLNKRKRDRMADKQIIYEPAPEFDQLSQYVTQGDPIEKDDSIYFPCIVHDLPPEEEGNPEFMF